LTNTPHLDRPAADASSFDHPPEPERIALCHEWLSGRSGSEKTFEMMAQEFPRADLFSLTWNRSAEYDFGGRAVSTTVLDRISPLRGKNALQLPLMPLAWRYASRREYDIVVTSSHACSKGFYPGREAIHLCYCYTPMRYLWLSNIDARHRRGARLTAPVSRALKRWDLKSAGWVDDFAGISHAVKDRIQDVYSRPARVIHPPVATDFYTPGGGEREDFVLAVSRMVPYKRLDLAIRAAQLAGTRLVIAGSGPQEQQLRQIAGDLAHPVEFVISPSDAALRELYRTARAVIFPPEEDFGIVPVEAQACGTPVVALARGGSLDTVVDGVTGVLVPEQSAEPFAEGLKMVLDGRFRPEDGVVNAGRFSQAQFRTRFRDWVLHAARGNGS
jgi:glycosyltransferase involved in cell wall biosynthesis